MNKLQNVRKRFYRYVNPIETEKGCFEWIGAKNELGYGRFFYQGKNRIATRIVWILENYELPDNLWVLHHCDNPACVNIKHLWLGNHQDNMTDMNKKKRHALSKGEKNPKAKRNCTLLD
jgi:hypothetical protein